MLRLGIFSLFLDPPTLEVGPVGFTAVGPLQVFSKTNQDFFVGPTDLGEVGPIDSLPSVRSFVRPSVCYKFFSATNHRICLIFLHQASL